MLNAGLLSLDRSIGPAATKCRKEARAELICSKQLPSRAATPGSPRRNALASNVATRSCGSTRRGSRDAAAVKAVFELNPATRSRLAKAFFETLKAEILKTLKATQ